MTSKKGHGDFVCGSRLIYKHEAPRCCVCDRLLWVPIYKYPGIRQYDNGMRLGRVPVIRDILRSDGLKTVRCWNTKECERRRLNGEVR